MPGGKNLSRGKWAWGGAQTLRVVKRPTKIQGEAVSSWGEKWVRALFVLPGALPGTRLRAVP